MAYGEFHTRCWIGASVESASMSHTRHTTAAGRNYRDRNSSTPFNRSRKLIWVFPQISSGCVIIKYYSRRIRKECSAYRQIFSTKVILTGQCCRRSSNNMQQSFSAQANFCLDLLGGMESFGEWWCITHHCTWVASRSHLISCHTICDFVIPYI